MALEHRLEVRDKLVDLLQQECRMLTGLEEIVKASEEALARGDLSAVEQLSDELGPKATELETFHEQTTATEDELVAIYIEFPHAERAKELSELLALRTARTQQLKHHIEKQQHFCQALAKHMDSLTEEGRGLNTALQAFHGYRRAAQMDQPLLNMRK